MNRSTFIVSDNVVRSVLLVCVVFLSLFGSPLVAETCPQYLYLAESDIHDHGPLIDGREAEMTGTYRGGCMDETLPEIVPATAKADGAVGPNSCKLVQDVIFVQ